MKSNWQTKKIDDACNVEYGTRVVNKRDGGSIYPVYGGGGATFFMDTYNRENKKVWITLKNISVRARRVGLAPNEYLCECGHPPRTERNYINSKQ